MIAKMVGINRLTIVVCCLSSWVYWPVRVMLHNCAICLLQIMMSWHYVSMGMRISMSMCWYSMVW